MISKRTVLKKALSKKYCSATRFEYLDDDERIMIYKAMQDYAELYHEEQKILDKIHNDLDKKCT